MEGISVKHLSDCIKGNNNNIMKYCHVDFLYGGFHLDKMLLFVFSWSQFLETTPQKNKDRSLVTVAERWIYQRENIVITHLSNEPML